MILKKKKIIYYYFPYHYSVSESEKIKIKFLRITRGLGLYGCFNCRYKNSYNCLGVSVCARHSYIMVDSEQVLDYIYFIQQDLLHDFKEKENI